MITVKLNIEIQLLEDNRSHPADFNKLIGFFNNLKTIHTIVIKQCCEEFSKTGKNQKLRKEHKLQLEEIQYGKTLKISLFFGCDVKTFCLYFSIIKEILNVCEIYVGTTDIARITIAGIQNAVIDLLKKINEKLPKILPDSKYNEIEKEITNGKTTGSLIEKLEDQKFKKSYNSLCGKSIFISKLTLFYNTIEETLIDKTVKQ
jgi:hypothetical protein